MLNFETLLEPTSLDGELICQLTVGQEVVELFLIRRPKEEGNALWSIKKDFISWSTYLRLEKWEPIKTDTYDKLQTIKVRNYAK